MINANINEEIILREKIIKLALLQLNKLYKHGSHGPDTFDCAGLVWYIYHQIYNIDIYDKGIGISTTTKIMTSSYGNLTLYQEDSLTKNLHLLHKGDIVLFHRQSLNDYEPREDNKYPGHCGIYLENNDFIHCSRPKGKVIISNFDNNPYWQKVLVSSKDIISNYKL